MNALVPLVFPLSVSATELAFTVNAPVPAPPGVYNNPRAPDGTGRPGGGSRVGAGAGAWVSSIALS